MADDNLLPDDFDDEDQIVAEDDFEDDTAVGYKNSYYFDIESGDFLRDGTNKVLPSTGIEAFSHWCEKCLMTQRNACLAYDSDFGIDLELAFASTSHPEIENILRTEITEALNADPYERLDYIDEISFNWISSTDVEVTVVIVGIDGSTSEVEVTYQGG